MRLLVANNTAKESESKIGAKCRFFGGEIMIVLSQCWLLRLQSISATQSAWFIFFSHWLFHVNAISIKRAQWTFDFKAHSYSCNKLKKTIFASWRLKMMNGCINFHGIHGEVLRVLQVWVNKKEANIKYTVLLFHWAIFHMGLTLFCSFLDSLPGIL